MARKSYYLPKSDRDRLVWLNNFSSKFALLAAVLGFLAAEVTVLANDTAMLSYIVNLVETFTSGKEERVAYKNLIKDGPIGTPGGTLPIAPLVPAPPTIVAPGIFPRVALLVQRIKNSPNYTDAIGKDLGIIGAEQERDFTGAQPTLKLVKKGLNVEVQWNKGDADSIHIECDRGTGIWQFLAVDSVPHYTDNTPVTSAALWKYRAMYIVDDQLLGNWSAVASIAVG